MEWNQIQCTFYAFRKCYCCSLVFRKYAKQFVLFALWGECEFRIICMANREAERVGERGRGVECEVEGPRAGSTAGWACFPLLLTIWLMQIKHVTRLTNI